MPCVDLLLLCHKYSITDSTNNWIILVSPSSGARCQRLKQLASQLFCCVPSSRLQPQPPANQQIFPQGWLSDFNQFSRISPHPPQVEKREKSLKYSQLNRKWSNDDQGSSPTHTPTLQPPVYFHNLLCAPSQPNVDIPYFKGKHCRSLCQVLVGWGCFFRQ